MSLTVEVKRDFGSFVLDVRFSSEAGRIGILGASGSGKSMTLRSIAGVTVPDSGKIILNGRTLFDSSARRNLAPQKRNIGYLFQNYALFPTMTVEENIACGLMNRKDIRGRETKREMVSDMIRRLKLTGLEKRFPSELSGGQQQRVALARILVYEPEAILLDEPFSALDTFLKDQLQLELTEMLADYQGVVLMVSHSRDEIYRFCSDTIVLDHGKVIDGGPTREVFHAPKNAASARLTGCKNISRAEKLDDHTVRALDWNMTLHLEERVPDDLKDVGFRAHEFIPVYGEREENCLRVRPGGEADLPFEKYFYLLPDAEPGRETDEKETPVLSWRVQRNLWSQISEKGLPPYLKMPEEAILLLV